MNNRIVLQCQRGHGQAVETKKYRDRKQKEDQDGEKTIKCNDVVQVGVYPLDYDDTTTEIGYR